MIYDTFAMGHLLRANICYKNKSLIFLLICWKSYNKEGAIVPVLTIGEINIELIKTKF